MHVISHKNVIFFLTPNELLAQGPAGVGKAVRLGGLVKPRSVQWDDTTLELHFQIVDTASTGELVVHSRGAPPQMFRDGMGVVVEGKLGSDGVFQSSQLLVKHSNEYRAPKPGEKPQEMYKTLIQGAAPK